jgi:hypothetical protein
MRSRNMTTSLLIVFPLICGAQGGPQTNLRAAPITVTGRFNALEGAIAAGVSQPLFPAWLTVGGQLRARVEGFAGGGFAPNNSDSYVLTRGLLNAKLRPSRMTSFFVEGMDSRAPGKNAAPVGPPFRDNVDLRQLYGQVGPDNGSAMLRVGRQELLFGDGRLVGSSLWTNTARTFDAARGSFIRTKYRLDAFAAAVVKIDQDRFDKNIPGNNFYGIYGTIARYPKTTVEPFFFWRRQSHLTTELRAPGTMNFGTLGLRVAGKPSAVDYDAQIVGQRGSLGDESIRAWAGHGSLGYTFAATPHTPRAFAEYNQASGDHNPIDNTRGTFDQLYPTGHDKYGLTDLVGWQNMRHVRGGLDVAIVKGWNATARYSRYWLADPHDALYSGGGVVLARSPTGAAGDNVGQEIDLIASGRVRQGLGFSAGIGRFLPGTFLKITTPGKPYTYPYAMLTYDF